jgi:hypothetical protein
MMSGGFTRTNSPASTVSHKPVQSRVRGVEIAPPLPPHEQLGRPHIGAGDLDAASNAKDEPDRITDIHQPASDGYTYDQYCAKCGRRFPCYSFEVKNAPTPTLIPHVGRHE